VTGSSVTVMGVVQGVGFRPAVWQLAQKLNLAGSVWNSAAGVEIELWGNIERVEILLQKLQNNPPPLSIIDEIKIQPLSTPAPDSLAVFTIRESREGKITTEIAADAATCPACIDELFDPTSRHYHHPFTNCTHCGPRLSIIKAIPYDRSNTAMATFPLCQACQEEYNDPDNRRFHAQPICCNECGPILTEGSITQIAKDIDNSKIVAIKGVGGFHLACDATNEGVVERLRERKQRPQKPFAVMVKNLAQLSHYATPNPTEIEALKSSAAPIVILKLNSTIQKPPLAHAVSPIEQSVGFIFPYSPIHHLLMDQLETPIVLTSGNHYNQPQCIENSTAQNQLTEIADSWLLHDREIINRLDDSVMRTLGGKIRTVRYARGMAPKSTPLPAGFSQQQSLLAMGAELKNSFALLKNGRITLSQYIGDLEEGRTFADYHNTHHLYRQLYDHKPDAIVVDLHPNYLSSQLGRDWSRQQSLPLFEVQHHHAHISACMVEHNLPADTSPLLGVALDGLGYGESSEETLWGSEFLLCNYHKSQRLAHFNAVAMPGGEQAVKEPWRNSFSHLAKAIGMDALQQRYPTLSITNFLQNKDLATLDKMVTQEINSPLTSSCGRLIDAVAATIGICRETISFEGEAAITLEAVAKTEFDQAQSADSLEQYPFTIGSQNGCSTIEWGGLWKALLDDLAEEISTARIAARFHHTLINAISSMAERLLKEHQLSTVVLSGGVFQNSILLEGVERRLTQTGASVLSPQHFPSNDQGIALGQVAIAAARCV